MQNDTAQSTLFQVLRTRLPKDKGLAECLMQWLNLSSDSAYRRIRGETPLTVNELVRLSEVTGLSPNDLLLVAAPGKVLFEPTMACADAPDFFAYLTNIERQLLQVLQLDKKELIYCSKDLPIFHFFLHPELAAFKFHFWMQIIMQHESFRDKVFIPGQVPAEITSLMQSALKLYADIPSAEIWNSESLNSTLFQIEFYRTAGYFNQASDIRMLYDQLELAMAHVELQAEHAAKFLPGTDPQYRPKNYQLFYNQVALADNTMLANTSEGTVAVLNYGVLNYLTCYDQQFCQSVVKDIDNIMKRSTKLSEGNTRHRAMFFNALSEKIARYRKLI